MVAKRARILAKAPPKGNPLWKKFLFSPKRLSASGETDPPLRPVEEQEARLLEEGEGVIVRGTHKIMPNVPVEPVAL